MEKEIKTARRTGDGWRPENEQEAMGTMGAKISLGFVSQQKEFRFYSKSKRKPGSNTIWFIFYRFLYCFANRR